MLSDGWYIMTVITLLCLFTCIVLTVLQIQSIRWYRHHYSDKDYLTLKERLLLHGVYLGGIVCSAQCFALHISNYFGDWFCNYGIGVCTVFYIAEKSFLYGFFLERAKSLQILLDKEMLPQLMVKYVLPIYIAAYFLTFSILSVCEYRGRIQYPLSINELSVCRAWRYYHWMFIVGAVVDGITCSILLFLFIYPLYDAIRSSNDTQHYKRLLNVIKINATASTVCMLSSILSMIILGSHWDHIDYVWLLSNIDMLINALFTFIIPDANRKYVRYLHHCCEDIDPDGSLSVFESATTRRRDLSTIYEVESKYERGSVLMEIANIQQSKQREPILYLTQNVTLPSDHALD